MARGATKGVQKRRRIASEKPSPGEYIGSDYFHKNNGERCILKIYDNCNEIDFYTDPDYWQHTDWNKYAHIFPQDVEPLTWFDIALRLDSLGFYFNNSRRWEDTITKIDILPAQVQTQQATLF
jgi:hypothetical protein